MDKTKMAVSAFDKNAETYQEKFMNLDLYHASFDLFCSKIPNENAEILEIACGPGNITQYLLKKRPDFKILGIDLAPKMLDLARINNPSAVFKLMDCRKIGDMDEKYDGIMCGFCLPYLSREETAKLISDAHSLLKSGGVFYLSTMEDVYSKSRWQTSSTGDQVYMYYHEGEYLTEMLKENNFEVIHLSRQDYPEKDGSKTIDLLIIGKRT